MTNKQAAAAEFRKYVGEKHYKISAQTLNTIDLFANQYDQFTEDAFVEFCVNQKLTNTSYERLKSVFNRFFIFCIEKGIVSENPITAEVDKKIESSFPKKKVIYTKEDIGKACDFYVEGKKYLEALIVYSLFEGITLEELVAIKKDDVKVKNVVLPDRLFRIDKYHKFLLNKVGELKIGFFYNNRAGKLTQYQLREDEYVVRFIDNSFYPSTDEEKVVKLRRKLTHEGFSKLILRDSGIIHYAKDVDITIEKFQMTKSQITRIVHSYDSLREA